MTGDLATIANIVKNDQGEVTGDTLHLEAALVDPAGRTRCRHDLEVTWDKDTVRNDVNGDKVERAHFGRNRWLNFIRFLAGSKGQVSRGA